MDARINARTRRRWPPLRLIVRLEGSVDSTSDPNTSLCDNLDYSSEMAEDKKRWLCVPRREKKYTKYKTTKKINKNVLMLLFLFEIKIHGFK